MDVRFIDKPEITGSSDTFNGHGIGEVIVGFREGDMDSCFIRELEVRLDEPLPDAGIEPGTWISMSVAFQNNLLITDDYSLYFREPKSKLERDRGFY